MMIFTDIHSVGGTWVKQVFTILHRCLSVKAKHFRGESSKRLFWISIQCRNWRTLCFTIHASSIRGWHVSLWCRYQMWMMTPRAITCHVCYWAPSIIHYQSNKLLPTLTLALKMHKQDHNSLRVDHKWGFIFSITWECVDGPLRRCIKSWQMHNKANVQCTCIETVSALLWVLFLLPSSLQYPGQSAPNCQCMMAAIQTSRVSYRDHISVSPALHLFLCHKIDADTIFIQTWTSIRQCGG